MQSLCQGNFPSEDFKIRSASLGTNNPEPEVPTILAGARLACKREIPNMVCLLSLYT